MTKAAYFLWAVALLAGETAGKPVPVEGLAAIPDAAELICSSAREGQKSDSGQPSNELYACTADGRTLTRITHHRKLYNHFAVSPDRKRIAAGRHEHGDTNGNGRVEAFDRKTLMVMDLENKQEWALVPELDAAFGGVDWTPDGRYIIASIRVLGRMDIYRIRPDGTGMENLTKNLGKLLGSNRPHFVSDVSVSSDGKWIVFLYTAAKGTPTRIVRMKLDGSEAGFVTDGGGADAKHAGGQWGPGDFDPEMSPDGRRICFQRATNAHLSSFRVASHDIMTIQIDGSGLKRLSGPDNKAVHGICDWSDNDRIVFSEWNEQDRWTGAVMVNPDGSGYHRIAGLAGCTWVRWIPRK
jgi:Tol biopolymer transport system component